MLEGYPHSKVTLQPCEDFSFALVLLRTSVSNSVFELIFGGLILEFAAHRPQMCRFPWKNDLVVYSCAGVLNTGLNRILSITSRAYLFPNLTWPLWVPGLRSLQSFANSQPASVSISLECFSCLYITLV